MPAVWYNGGVQRIISADYRSRLDNASRVEGQTNLGFITDNNRDARQPGHWYAGLYQRSKTVLFTGIYPQIYIADLTASLSFVGTKVQQTSKTLPAAAVSFAGSLLKQTLKPLTAAPLGFSGAVQRQTGKSLAGGASFVGGIKKDITHGMSAALTYAGSLLKSTSKSYNAAVSFVGIFVKGAVFYLNFTASTTPTGSISKATSKAQVAQIAFSGAMTKGISKGLSAAVSFVGTLQRATSHGLTAAISFVGLNNKKVSKNLSGSAGFSGLLTSGRLIVLNFTAATIMTAALSRRVGKVHSGSLPSSGVLKKGVSKSFAAAAAFAGGMVKGIKLRLASSTGFVGFLSAFNNSLPRLFILDFTASVSFSGDTKKKTSKGLAAVLAFSTVFPKVIRKQMAAVLQPIPDFYTRGGHYLLEWMVYVRSTLESTSVRSVTDTGYLYTRQGTITFREVRELEYLLDTVDDIYAVEVLGEVWVLQEVDPIHVLDDED